MKTYKVRYSRAAVKKLKKLDKPIGLMIVGWVRQHLEDCTDPRQIGKALTGNRKGLWRYRVGDYRIIADIQDDEVLILVVDVGHRGTVYR